MSWASNDLTGVRVLASKMAHSNGGQGGAGSWQEGSVPGLLDFSKGLPDSPQNMAEMASPRVSERRECTLET